MTRQVLIEIDEGEIEKLLKCKQSKKKAMKSWDISWLLDSAIDEFYQKYGKDR